MTLMTGLLGTGCTHQRLTHNTVMTAGTVMDVQYRMVLTNLAMFSAHPESLPSNIVIEDGVIQVSDEVGFGLSGGFTSIPNFGIDDVGPSGRRQVVEQWGADATLDPQRLTDLQDLYRTALGLPPLPPSKAIEYLRKLNAKDESSDSNGSSPIAFRVEDEGLSDKPRQVPIDVLLEDVPEPGWFSIGCKRDVPKNACYVGNFGDRYAWVTPTGVPELARFTVTLLAAVKLEPSDGRRRGLAVR